MSTLGAGRGMGKNRKQMPSQQDLSEPLIHFCALLNSKESACNVGDPGSIPGLGRFPGGEKGNPLQYSCLENPMDRGALWATVHGLAKKRLSTCTVNS